MKGKGAVLESTSSSVGRAEGKVPDGICRLNGLDPIARDLIAVAKGDDEVGEDVGVGSGVRFQDISGV